MSKVNAMQAMREARYAAARTSRPASPVPASPVPASPVPASPVPASSAPTAVPAESPADGALLPVGDAPAAEPAQLDEVSTEALCGHRSMNNRICRRPAGHPEKNHRYN